MGEPDARDALKAVNIQLPQELLAALDQYAAARSIGSRSVAARHALAQALDVELPVELMTGVRARKHANPTVRAAAMRKRYTTRAGRVSEILQAVRGGPVTRGQRAAVVSGLAHCGNCGEGLVPYAGKGGERLVSCPRGCTDKEVALLPGVYTSK